MQLSAPSTYVPALPLPVPVDLLVGDIRAPSQADRFSPFAGIYKGFCLDVIRNKYECELQGAKQHLEVSRQVGLWEGD